MKKLLLTLLATAFGLMAMAQVGTIENITVEQRTDGSGIVDISFDLTGPVTNKYNIDIEASFNGGDTYTAVGNEYLTGNIYWVSPATGLEIIWDGMASHPEVYSEETMLKIVATLVGGDDTEVVEVINPVTGKTWMDRNLGATRAATSSTDSLAYGDLYQWGRAADGHQFRTSGTTSTLSSSDTPGHGDFIITASSPYDWRSPQNNNLWQGINGINNPCPAGYRIPTEAELNAERESWSSNDAAGAFLSPLKLPMAGRRLRGDGSLHDVGSTGTYWSSTVSNMESRLLFLSGSDAYMMNFTRSPGISVRCLKDPDQSNYGVILQVSPGGSGQVTGAGSYPEGATVTITATPNTGYAFLNWTGDTEYITDANAASTVLSMPAQNITLIANFEEYAGGDDTEVVEVLNPATGKTWMDRNLGASRAATSSTDAEAYGDLYQWGRAADGHQFRESGTTTILSNSDTPGHGDFILAANEPGDWRSPQNDNLWQGVNGVNNPCPTGFRPPTEAELNDEMNSWNSNNADGAYDSPLKLTVAGGRFGDNGSFFNVGTFGHYWTSTVSSSDSRRLAFGGFAGMLDSERARGLSVRCIKETENGGGDDTEVVDVFNPATGKTWMDRNLGASRAATSSTDAEAYGDLYQWGRAADGHQVRTSATTTTLSNSDTPGHGDFILAPESSRDWRSPQNDNLWQGISGINNPCPSGYRLPTEAEWESERTSWGSNNASGAFASPLKLPVSGIRDHTYGLLFNVDHAGFYWSNTVSSLYSASLSFGSGNTVWQSGYRADGRSVRCLKDSDQSTFNVILNVSPDGTGQVTGAGQYPEGTTVNITATPNTGYSFVNWTGDTEYIADAEAASTSLTMPGQNITLTANFEEDGGGNIQPGEGVTDIDGNFYPSVIIGNQEWMAENLRVAKYNNGNAIPTGLNDSEWENTTAGAYDIYDNNNDMLEAYGKHYNWYAADDARGLCPAGWRVPSDDDWTVMIDYVIAQGYPNNNVFNGAGNALKSCRQVNHPFGGDCDTWELPHWYSNSTHYGFDEFGFSALPGGARWSYGPFDLAGSYGAWWSSTENGISNAWYQSMNNTYGNVSRNSGNKRNGFSVRCIKGSNGIFLNVSPESFGQVTGAGQYPEGTAVNITATPNTGYLFINWTGDTEYIADADAASTTLTMPAQDVNLTANFEEYNGGGNIQPGEGVTDIDGNFYPSVIIGNQEWMDENLKTTKYRNGTSIEYPGTNNTAWQNNTTGAYAWYDNDIAWKDNYGALYNWHAVNNSNGLCPTGWHVPSDAEWAELLDYVVDQGYPNENDNPNGVGNALKSCRQVSSPMGGDCATTEHPRWAPSNHSGIDVFGFSALPGGKRHGSDAEYQFVGGYGWWWSSNEGSTSNANLWGMDYHYGYVYQTLALKRDGLSVRCLKD